MSTTPEDSPKPRRKTPALLLFAISVIFLCGACGIISLFLPDTGSEPATESETQVAEIVIEETQQPTAEPTQPQPTAEPSPLPTEPPPTEPPTAIPPTDIPQPTATAEIDEDAAAELLYRAEMAEILETYYTSMQGIGTQSTAVASDVSLLFNDEWKIRTAVYLAGLTMAGESLRELKPPARLEEVHADLLEAADHFDRVVTNYSQGIDEIDADKINQAAASLELGSQAMDNAAEKLVALDTP